MSVRDLKIISSLGKPRLFQEILFWLAMVGLFPFFILVLPQHFFADAALIDNEKQALHQALKARVDQIEKWLDNVSQDLDFIAESSCARGNSPHLSPDGDPNYCPFQAAVIRSHSAYRAIRVYGPRGELLSGTGEEAGCLTGRAEQRLAEITAMGGGLYIAPDYCLEKGATLVTVGKKITGQSPADTTFILALLDLNQAVDGFATSPFLASGKFYVISRAGRYLYPPAGNPGLHGSMVDWLGEFLISVPGEPLEYYHTGGELVLGAYREVPGTAWLMVKEVGRNVVNIPRQTLSRRSLLAGAVALFVIFFGSYLVARRLTRPLEELAAAADSVYLGETGRWQKVPEFFQREVDRVGKAFNDMQDRLRESEKTLVKAASLAAIGEFSARIVHDIRSPLSSINLSLRSLAKSPLDGRDRQRLAIAREQADRLMNMADRVLSYGKPLQLNPEKFTLGQLFAELKKDLASDLAEKEVELRIIGGDLQDIEIQADYELLLETLTNLVNNAAQWSPPHGVIELEGRSVPEAGRKVLLRVADAGPGFTESNLDKVFQPFFTTRKKGTGFGLANARKIVEYHGGSISAANRAGGGAEIIIVLAAGGRPEDA